ncbi:putative phosphatase regulatory subunit-domain-containing protein, partial [Catenaria anguillulae PL171]
RRRRPAVQPGLGVSQERMERDQHVQQQPAMSSDESETQVPRLAYFPACAPVARAPCPWDTVVVEGIQLVVGVCPTPLLPRVPCTTTTAKATDRVRVSGTVLVKNVAFEKRVSLRATVDFWRTHTDIECHYVGPAEDAAGFDRFRFDLELTEHLGLMPNVDAHATVYFCVHYEYFVQEVVSSGPGSSPDGGFASGHVDRSSSVVSRWESAWDNNSGANYEVVVKRREGHRPSLESEIEEGGAITPCASPVPGAAGSPPKRAAQGVPPTSIEIAALNICSLRERSGCHLAE